MRSPASEKAWAFIIWLIHVFTGAPAAYSILQREIMREGFEMLEPDLMAFNLAEGMHLWFKTVTRTSVPSIENPETILKELKQVRKLKSGLQAGTPGKSPFVFNCGERL